LRTRSLAPPQQHAQPDAPRLARRQHQPSVGCVRLFENCSKQQAVVQRLTNTCAPAKWCRVWLACGAMLLPAPEPPRVDDVPTLRESALALGRLSARRACLEDAAAPAVLAVRVLEALLPLPRAPPGVRRVESRASCEATLIQRDECALGQRILTLRLRGAPEAADALEEGLRRLADARVCAVPQEALLAGAAPTLPGDTAAQGCGRTLLLTEKASVVRLLLLLCGRGCGAGEHEQASTPRPFTSSSQLAGRAWGDGAPATALLLSAMPGAGALAPTPRAPAGGADAAAGSFCALSAPALRFSLTQQPHTAHAPPPPPPPPSAPQTRLFRSALPAAPATPLTCSFTLPAAVADGPPTPPRSERPPSQSAPPAPPPSSSSPCPHLLWLSAAAASPPAPRQAGPLHGWDACALSDGAWRSEAAHHGCWLFEQSLRALAQQRALPQPPQPRLAASLAADALACLRGNEAAARRMAGLTRGGGGGDVERCAALLPRAPGTSGAATQRLVHPLLVSCGERRRVDAFVARAGAARGPPPSAVTHAPAQAALAAALAALLRRQDAALSALDCAVQERRAAECAEAGGGAPCGCLPPTLPEVLAHTAVLRREMATLAQLCAAGERGERALLEALHARCLHADAAGDREQPLLRALLRASLAPLLRALREEAAGGRGDAGPQPAALPAFLHAAAGHARAAGAAMRCMAQAPLAAPFLHACRCELGAAPCPLPHTLRELRAAADALALLALRRDAVQRALVDACRAAPPLSEDARVGAPPGAGPTQPHTLAALACERSAAPGSSRPSAADVAALFAPSGHTARRTFGGDAVGDGGSERQLAAAAQGRLARGQGLRHLLPRSSASYAADAAAAAAGAAAAAELAQRSGQQDPHEQAGPPAVAAASPEQASLPPAAAAPHALHVLVERGGAPAQAVLEALDTPHVASAGPPERPPPAPPPSPSPPCPLCPALAAVVDAPLASLAAAAAACALAVCRGPGSHSAHLRSLRAFLLCLRCDFADALLDALARRAQRRGRGGGAALRRADASGALGDALAAVGADPQLARSLRAEPQPPGAPPLSEASFAGMDAFRLRYELAAVGGDSPGLLAVLPPPTLRRYSDAGAALLRLRHAQRAAREVWRCAMSAAPARGAVDRALCQTAHLAVQLTNALAAHACAAMEAHVGSEEAEDVAGGAAAASLAQLASAHAAAAASAADAAELLCLGRAPRDAAMQALEAVFALRGALRAQAPAEAVQAPDVLAAARDLRNAAQRCAGHCAAACREAEGQGVESFAERDLLLRLDLGGGLAQTTVPRPSRISSEPSMRSSQASEPSFVARAV